MRRALACALLCLALGCASQGVRQAEIPETPIAISYLDEEEARRRAESYRDDRARRIEELRPGPTGARPTVYGRADLVASEEDLDQLIGSLLGGRPSNEGDGHLGRLALLNPRTLEVDVVAAARRGAVPLAWSADRERLLFGQPLDRSFQVYEYDLAAATVRAVTHGPRSHAQACYGPEGRIVVAVVDTRDEALQSHIAVSQPGGRGPYVALTEGPGDHSPACAPDGSGVAFVREPEEGRPEILFMAAEPGAAQRRLSPGRHPTFSPDAAWIAFAAPSGDRLRLWRIRPDGGGRAPIGRGGRSEVRPAVSPDGRLVAYVASESQPRRHLYLRRLDGTGDRILFAEGDGQYPVW